jgi:serine phosphatase RsbU (regulator of sigma subunit)
MEHDLSVARTIQQGLLPAGSPDIEGFEIAGWNQPADQTGGDYFDWQQLPNGKLAVTIADVTGHGIGPALVTAVCRAYSRASFPTGDELGTLMTRINELLVEDLPADRFITFVVGLLDPATGSVELLSAGHGPLFVYTSSDGRIENINAHHMPLGIAPSVGFGPSQQLNLEAGDLLVLLTDGFFEWANGDGEQYGTARLAETIRAASGLRPDQIISTMYASVIEFAGGTAQADDLTAVVVKRT